MIKTLEWTSQGVRFIDQTRLPMEEVFVTCGTYQEVATAIRDMIVRGAPAIGVAAAMGIALGVKHSAAPDIATLAHRIRADLPDHGRNPPYSSKSFLGHPAHAADV